MAVFMRAYGTGVETPPVASPHARHLNPKEKPGWTLSILRDTSLALPTDVGCFEAGP
jgi:hypothetical protein